ncbi:cysteine synthase [Solibacillus sp. CAU 1738]|uniref:cysteine synthase n=1 Tax=Solibacillus sp. CAU 1738 TaxID=3140363 RepID=UPI003260E159
MKVFTVIEFDSVKVETILTNMEIIEGDTLNGSLFVTAEDEAEHIDFITLKVLKMSGESYSIIGKHSVEMVGTIHTKDAEIVPFEIIPDERWGCLEGEKIIFQTIVTFLNGTEVKAEEEITYTLLD